MVNIEAKHLGLGKHSLTAIADPENKVLEWREDDNTSQFLEFEIIPDKDTMNPSFTPQLKSRGINKGHTERRFLSAP